MDPLPPSVEESPIPPMRLTCPHCQVRLSVSPHHAGATIACPKCGGKFQVPIPVAGSNRGDVSRPEDPDVAAFGSKKVAAGICGILLGGLGIHKFILGLNTAGIIMLAVWLGGFVTGMCLIIPFLASIAMNVIGLVEGIIYLTKSDDDFYETYAVQRKEWF